MAGLGQVEAMKEGVLQVGYLGEEEVLGHPEEEEVVVVVVPEFHARHPLTGFYRHRTRRAPDIHPPSPELSSPLSSFPPEQQALGVYCLSQPTSSSQ